LYGRLRIYTSCGKTCGVLSQQEYEGRDRLSFNRLLDVAYFALSRDDRDKVYVLVGMMDTAIAKQLAPDYNMETRSVFRCCGKSVHSDLR
jgi:hypothetical protein